MEAKYVRCLNNSISRFIHLMSCQTSKVMPSQNDFERMATMLKQLKPVLDEIDDNKIASEATLWKNCEDLDIYINAARDFVERWSPKMSKILSVLRSEELLKMVRRSTLEICGTFCRLLRTSLSSYSFTGVQHCVQELQSWQPQRILGHIEQALRSKNDGLSSCDGYLAEIVKSLGLVSNQELLKESIAVKKERVKFEANNSLEVDQENNLKPPNSSEIVSADDISTQDVMHADSFHCSVLSSDSMSRSSLEVGDAMGRLNIDNPYVSGEISSSMCRGLEAVKSNHRSPVHSYAHSRTYSATSAVSSCDYMPSSASELSRISDRVEKVGEIMSEPATSNSYVGVHSVSSSDSGYDETTTSSHVDELVENLKNPSNALQTAAAAELRLLAKNNLENRIIIGKCGAIHTLISLLHSDIKKIQEHSVTTLLNLSINEEIKAKISEAGIIEPLIHVLKTGNDTAKENSAAALFSFCLLEDFKLKIGRSGAVKALVDLLSWGTIRGKKDAAAALFNLSICHENKARLVHAGVVKYLVQLLDPSTGMVDKSVALLANLSTISEGRLAIAKEDGIPLIVEIVESGSQRGKENAASVLLQLCLYSTKYCNLVLQEGAIPPLVALSQSGTPRAKEKAQQLLSHFRTQREGAAGKKKK